MLISRIHLERLKYDAWFCGTEDDIASMIIRGFSPYPRILLGQQALRNAKRAKRAKRFSLDGTSL